MVKFAHQGEKLSGTSATAMKSTFSIISQKKFSGFASQGTIKAK